MIQIEPLQKKLQYEHGSINFLHQKFIKTCKMYLKIFTKFIELFVHSSRVPHGGFAQLSGGGGPQKFTN